MRYWTLLASILLFPLAASAGMENLSNDEMDEVSGQQGVAITLDWRLNVDKNGITLPLCTSASTFKECRVAWAFNNRGTKDVDQRWLVLKGFTGALYIPYLRVDASSVTYVTDSAANKTIPAVQLSLGDIASSSGATTKVLVKNLKIDNIAMEQDNGSGVSNRRGYFADSSCEPTGAGTGTGVCAGTGANIHTNGAVVDVNTGFMGIQISGPDNPATTAFDPTAQIQIDGTVKLFSCLGDHQSC